MPDRLLELKKVYALRGDTYSSYEVIAMIGWAIDEIQQLRRRNPSLDKTLKSERP